MASAEKKANFIIIDDSALDCFIAEKLIKHAGVGGEVKSFLRAEDALKLIKELPVQASNSRTVILLDVMMPMMNGIQFVEEFERLPAELQNQYLIVAFTSSMNKKDILRIQAFRSVKQLYDKPLSLEQLSELIEECNLRS